MCTTGMLTRPTFLMHPPVWFHHILISTKDNPAGCGALTVFDRGYSYLHSAELSS